MPRFHSLVISGNIRLRRIPDHATACVRGRQRRLGDTVAGNKISRAAFILRIQAPRSRSDRREATSVPDLTPVDEIDPKTSASFC
jgi:hypothetical protein